MKTPTSSAVATWLCAALLAHASAMSATADELYRWTEPDGSITFSPGPPPAGTSFVRVGADDASPTAIEPARTTPLAAKATAAGTAGQAASSPQSLSYAPPPLGAAGNIDDDPDTKVSAAPIATETPLADTRADERTPTSAASRSMPTRQMGRVRNEPSSQREERCRELEKRVISLERRLATPLSADDMDNTVLYMARYQQNVDRHCRG